MTASGTLRRGLSVSPASSMPCRKPRKLKTMPEVAMAVKTPCQPCGLKPWEVKLPAWKEVKKKAMMTMVMIASFHHTRMVLIRANQRTPT